MINKNRQATKKRWAITKRQTIVALVISFIILIFGCNSPPPPDQLSELIEALKSKQWSKLQGKYLSTEQLREFPLKLALDQGDQWVGLKRVRKLDQYLVFEIDLRLKTNSKPNGKEEKQTDSERDPFKQIEETSRIKRFTFWVKAPTPTFQGDRPGISTTPIFREELEELGAIGEVVGWSEPELISYSMLSLSNLHAPREFVTNSYRTLNEHRKALEIAQIKLGVITGTQDGAIESGWNASLSLGNILWRNIKKRDCHKAKLKWTQKNPTLLDHLFKNCERPLLLTAQQHRYLEQNENRPQVDSAGEGGGRLLRAQQDQTEALITLQDTSKETQTFKNRSNGVEFNGRVTLRQPLLRIGNRIGNHLPPPNITEAMIIAPDLIRCLQTSYQKWSEKELPNAQCELEVTLNLKVSPKEPIQP